MANNMFASGFSPPYMLRVSTRTWMRDSHDLFDYETHQQVKVSHFATSCPLKLLRSDADVSIIEYNNMVEREHDHLLSIICKRTGEYVVMPAEKMPGSRLYPQKLWLIVRTLPYQRYALQENDIIKLGRFRLRVKQLVPGPLTDGPNSTSASAASSTSTESGGETQLVKLFDGVIPDKTITLEEQCNMQCRICLGEGQLHNTMHSGLTTPLNIRTNESSMDLDTATSKMHPGSNPSNSNTSSLSGNSDPNMGNMETVVNSASFDSERLICACECKGSIKYVHVDCLRKWIDSRWNLRGDEPLPSMVFIREVACELCKTNYPCYIRQNGELIQIVKMPKVPVPFLVLENITPHAAKGVHLLSMRDMKDLKLGRGHESDVRIPDVSISRYHATIRYDQGNFYLEDHDSKFGTLVAMRKPRQVSVKEPLAVQVGRSVINLSVDETLPYIQNTYMTIATPNQTTGGMPDTPGSGNQTFDVSSGPEQVGTLTAPAGPTSSILTPTNLTPTGTANSNVNRMALDLNDQMNPNAFMSYFQTYPSPLANIPQSAAMNVNNSPGNRLQTSPGTTNVITISNNGGTTVTANTNPMLGMASNTIPLSLGSCINTPGMGDLYWNYLRSATRQRFDREAVDGLTNQRLNSFRSAQPPTGGSHPGVPGNGVAGLGQAAMTAQTSGEELEMLLPDTVFIANWNNLPNRGVDLNGDTSTSALEHRHSGQDVDKPLTNLR